VFAFLKIVPFLRRVGYLAPEKPDRLVKRQAGRIDLVPNRFGFKSAI
jgi:hypothetical protein